VGGWRPSRLTFNRRTEGSSPQRGLGRSSVLAVAATAPLRWLKQDLDELAEVATGRSAWWRRSGTRGLSQPVPAAWGAGMRQENRRLGVQAMGVYPRHGLKRGIPGRCVAGPESSARSGNGATLSLRQSKEASRQIPRDRETVWQRMGEWAGITWSNLLRPAIWRKTEVDTAKPTRHRRLGQSKPLGPARVYCGRQGPIWQCRPHRRRPVDGQFHRGHLSASRPPKRA